jgi:F-type H+-transporting ATPase subunit b
MRLAAVLAAEEFQAHHWWWPETKEIIWGGLAFLIVAIGLWKYALPPMKQAMRDRRARIQEQLDKSATAKADAEADAAELTTALADLDSRKAQILADARAQADQLVEDGKVRNDEEMAELEARARADIASARSRGESELQHQVGAMAAEAAERFVSQTIDDELRSRLVDDFIAKVGAR